MGEMADLHYDHIAQCTEYCKEHDAWYHPEEDCQECMAKSMMEYEKICKEWEDR